MANALLQHFTESEVRHELRGFPERAVAAVIGLKQESSAEALKNAVPEILAFYLPSGVSTDLTTQPPSARLREDLGVDSLTFAEAAFKMGRPAVVAEGNPYADVDAFYVNPSYKTELQGSIDTASGTVKATLTSMLVVPSAYWIDVKSKILGNGTS